MDKFEGYEVLRGIIDEEIYHEDYKRVTDLAEKYYKLKTGDGIEELLHKIETRVTDEEFDQIKRIYKSIVPAILNSTKLPFLKAARKQPIVRMIDYLSGADEKKSEIEEYIGKYWGDKSLEEYLEYAFVDYNYIDPNAFLITEFDEFDPKSEKAKPYPFVADSSQAIMFNYKNEILEYLVVKLPIKYMDGKTEKKGVKYTMYLGMDTIVFSQVAGKNAIPEGADEVIEIKAKYYAVFYYEPKNEKIPAIRFGFLRDEQTKGRTFVSVFNCVLALLEKTLKIDSELDLSCAMVAFPRRYLYVTPCQHQGCNKGYMPDGSECPTCNGSGFQQAHKGTQDIVSLILPRNKEEMIDLKNMAYDHSPDIELLRFDSEFLEALEKKVQAKMFNADLYTRSEVATTATEKILETDNMNDTLYPFARQYSAIWEFVVQDIATFTDLGEGIILQHKFPNDFKFKSLADLMSDLKAAKDAGASSSTIAAIEDDINEILYSDRPDALKEIRVKNLINPFRGYSDANIRFIISQGNTTQYARTLWENMEAIFQELEIEHENPWIYDMEIKKIRELVKGKVEEYTGIINGQKESEYEKFVKNEV
ncbi:MAG: hypothetical protein PH343_01030 [Nitrospira sp.]|nr:hypothetical protein [Nitrospira sp.]